MPVADAGKCGRHARRRCLSSHQTHSPRPRLVRVLPPAGNHNLRARGCRRKHVPHNLPSGKPKAARHRQRSSRMPASAVAKRSSRSSKQPCPHALFHRQPHEPRNGKPRQSARQAERHRGAGRRAGSRKSRLNRSNLWPPTKPSGTEASEFLERIPPRTLQGFASHCRSQK
jgi:hypothetical protein